MTFNFNDLGIQPGTYTLINFSGATASGVDLDDFVATGIAGTFSVTSTGVEFVTAVPEPGTVVAGLLTAGALGWHDRRRFRARRAGAVTRPFTVVS